MKVIIAGSRDIIDGRVLDEALIESGFEVTEVVCGGAKGADELGLIYGTSNDIPVKMMKADWRYGKSAGRERNVRMARYGDALIALWDGESRGTAYMIRVARVQGLKVFVKMVDKQGDQR